VTLIKVSPVLRDGAEVATIPVNNETITAIADWRDTTVIHEEREDYLDLRPPIHRVFAMMIGLAS
jgi:hypothetical protein